MTRKYLVCVGTTCALLLGSAVALAGLSADELARLGADLTPMGAEKGGNPDGSIPAWDGGIKSPPVEFKPGGHHPDPFPEDRPKFVIDKSNASQYADKLTEGHKAMLNLYGDTFFMNVYETRRTAAFPERIYEATKKAAATAELVEGGNGVTGAIIGTPFPIPKNGLEVIWNHILRYRADAVRNIGQAPVTRNGTYTMVKLLDNFILLYAHPDATEENLDNIIAMFTQYILAPPRLAGQILLVHETLNQAKEHRKAWIYNPGQRRVRRAPNVAFDNPGTAADGLRTSDQLDMYNGSPERYEWALLGKKEIYVPYNSYKLHSNTLKYSDILRPLHMNPEHLRYELHRVWVVDATVKEGTRHIYKRRTFYVDEDSWQVLAVDQHDNRDQLWRVSEGHVINYYDVPNLWTTVEAHYDLQSGRYIAVGLNNEEAFTYDFSAELTRDEFTPAALRRSGRR